MIGYLIEVNYMIYTECSDDLLLMTINFNIAIDTHISIFPEDVKITQFLLQNNF